MSRNWMYTFGFKSFKQLKNHVHNNKVEGFLIAVFNTGNELGARLKSAQTGTGTLFSTIQDMKH